MRKVTIILDEETARWARVEAAKRGSSVSRLVEEMLRDHMMSEEAYERARRSYTGRSATLLKKGRTTYPTRDEIHSR